MDSEFLWTLFSKWANSSGHFLMVNSRGHILVVITNGWSANTGDAGAKLQLGSANTGLCQVRGCCGEVPARISEHWAIEARIRRRDGIFPHEWRSHEWGKIKFPMSHKWLATSDKWGILPILSSYPSFNNIPDTNVETHIEQLSQNYRNFFETAGKKYFPIVLNHTKLGEKINSP
jgi:hypothetical protein